MKIFLKKTIILFKYLFLFLVAFFYLLGTWYKKIFSENKLLAGIFIGTCVFLLLIYSKRKNTFKIFFVLFFILLALFQIKTTNYKYEYILTPAEIDLQIQRMNQYPPKLAKLGYLLEFKRETMLLNKWQNNLFSIFDFNLYFGNYFPYLLIPLCFYGVFVFIKNGHKFLLHLLILSLIILSFTGKNGKYGPFLIFPFILLFIFIGFLKLVRLIKK